MNRLSRSMAYTIRLLILFFVAGHCYAAMYKWVDEAGNVHYTQSPPPEGLTGETLETKYKTGDEAGAEELERLRKKTDALADEREKRKEAEREAAEKRAHNEGQCNQARERLATYSKPRVRFQEEDGSIVRATEERRLGEVAKSEAMIQEFCNPKLSIGQ